MHCSVSSRDPTGAKSASSTESGGTKGMECQITGLDTPRRAHLTPFPGRHLPVWRIGKGDRDVVTSYNAHRWVSKLTVYGVVLPDTSTLDSDWSMQSSADGPCHSGSSLCDKIRMRSPWTLAASASRAEIPLYVPTRLRKTSRGSKTPRPREGVRLWSIEWSRLFLPSARGGIRSRSS